MLLLKFESGKRKEADSLFALCGLGTVEGEEQKVLSPSLGYSYADPHAHQALGRPVDRR
jgi:hypothetical protein